MKTLNLSSAFRAKRTLDLLDSLSRSSIKLILTRHEQAAGFMAATYGRLTGKAGVCLSTLGPGATNLVTAAAYAQLGGMPMLMITGQKPIKTSKQGQFQIVDVVDMMDPITKYTQQIVSGANIPYASSRGLSAWPKRNGPAPCHLELPEDIAQEEVTGASFASQLRPGDPLPRKSRFSRLLRWIKEARRPLLVIGAAARIARSPATSCGSWSSRTGIPFVTTQMGKGVVDETRSAVSRQCGALGGRLRASRDRACRPDHQRRPRRHRKAAVLHEAGRASR